MIVKYNKIAVPTDDGETISENFGTSRAYMVFTTDGSGITEKELRWNLLSEALTSKDGRFYNLCDCNSIIINEDGQCSKCTYRITLEKDMIKTHKKLLSEVLSEFIEQA